MINEGINETLSRTIMTAGTTLLAVLALFLLGGEVLRGLSFVLLFGILIGTYSTIYIASAMVLYWEKREAAKDAARARAGEDRGRASAAPTAKPRRSSV